MRTAPNTGGGTMNGQTATRQYRVQWHNSDPNGPEWVTAGTYTDWAEAATKANYLRWQGCGVQTVTIEPA